MKDAKVIFINDEMIKSKTIKKSIEIMALEKLFKQNLISQDRYLQLKDKVIRLANAWYYWGGQVTIL